MKTEELDKKIPCCKLRVPKKVKDYSKIIVWHKGDRITKYVDIIQLYKGRFLLRRFGIRRNKRLREIKECYREYEGSSIQAHNDTYFTGMGGWNLLWEDEYHCYTNLLSTNKFFKLQKIMNINPIKLWTVEELINLDSKLKYMSYNGYIPILTWINKYRNNTKLEFFGKLKLGYLITDKRVLKKVTNDKMFRRFLYENASYISQNKVRYNDIIKVYISNLSFIKYESIVHFLLGNSELTKLFKSNSKIVINYIDKMEKVSSHFSTDYSDYIIAAKRAKWDLSDETLLLPRTPELFNELHQRAIMCDPKLIENENLMKKYQKIVNKISSLEYSNGKFNLIIPKSYKDFVDEGNHLNICVGSLNMKYYDNMAKGKNWIFFIRTNPQESLECVEFDYKNMNVIQVRGKNNQPSEYHTDILKFIGYWQNEILKPLLPSLLTKKQVLSIA